MSTFMYCASQSKPQRELRYNYTIIIISFVHNYVTQYLDGLMHWTMKYTVYNNHRFIWTKMSLKLTWKM